MSVSYQKQYACDICGRSVEVQEKWEHLARKRYYMDLVGGVKVDIKSDIPYQHPNESCICADCVYLSLAETMRKVSVHCTDLHIEVKASKTKQELKEDADKWECLVRDLKDNIYILKKKLSK